MKNPTLTFCLLIPLMGGCCSPPDYARPDWPADAPWNTAYLLDADPSAVTDADLATYAGELSSHYEDHSEVLGCAWEPRRSDADQTDPDQYGNGGDSAYATGHALAGRVWRWQATGDQDALDGALRALKGLYLLTHATGTPGVICRNAFPQGREAEWDYPAAWQHRIDKGFVGRSPAAVPNGFGGLHPPVVYYTRATKDQLAGIVLGLAVAWDAFDAPVNTGVVVARQTIAKITAALVAHLKAHDWRIVDEHGRNDTNADHVSGMSRTQLLALWARTSAITGGQDAAREEYEDSFDMAGEWLGFLDNRYSSLQSTGDPFNLFSNRTQYFAWNLRYIRAFTIWLLAYDQDTREEAVQYMDDWLWPHTKDHQNPWFIFLRAAMSDRSEKVDVGVWALRSLKLKPLRNWPSPYAGQEHFPRVWDVVLRCTGAWVLPPHLRKPTDLWTWAKEPWDTGHMQQDGLWEDSGLSFLAPYWLGRAHGLVAR